VTILDAYTVLAYLRGEPSADQVAALLRQPTTLTAANAAEVVDQLVRVFAHDADDVHGDLLLLANIGMEIAAVTVEVGLLAGRLRGRHYERDTMAVSLADCIAAATALTRRQSLATADPALARMLRREGGTVHALPDSRGRLP